MRYRRSKASGGTFFFTVVTYERRNTLCLPENIILLENVFAEVKTKHPFEMDAFIILPDHVHCIWTLPPGDNNFSMRWMLIKSNFSRMHNEVESRLSDQSRLSKRERSVWQRRFWEHEIRDERDLKAHIEYIHYNPVKHGLAKSPADWPHSSFHRYEAGIYEKDWAADCEMSFEKGVGGE